MVLTTTTDPGAITVRIAAGEIDADLYLQRGLIALEAKRFLPAIADFREALRLNPSSLQAYYFRAFASQHLKTPDQIRALGDLTDALRFDPRCTPARLDRGDAYRLLGDAMCKELSARIALYRRAVADYTEVLRDDPENPRALANSEAASDALTGFIAAAQKADASSGD